MSIITEISHGLLRLWELIMKQALTLLCGITLCNCAHPSLLTEHSNKTSSSESIGHYSIPKAIVKLDIETTYSVDYLENPKDVDTRKAVSISLQSASKLIPHSHHNLYYQPSAASNDEVKIETTKEGFLDLVTVTSEDQSGQILEGLSKLLIQGVKTVSIFDDPPRSTFTISEDTITEKQTIYVDPYTTSVKHLNYMDGQSQLTLSVEQFVPHTASGNFSEITQTDCSGKLCYPVIKTAVIEVRATPNSSATQIINIPDIQNLAEIDISRASFVKKGVTVDFENGLLKSVELKKPSEMLSVISVPTNILAELFKLPTELVQLKIDTSGKSEELIKAEESLLETQESLRVAIQKIEEAQKAETGKNDYDAGG